MPSIQKEKKDTVADRDWPKVFTVSEPYLLFVHPHPWITRHSMHANYFAPKKSNYYNSCHVQVDLCG